MNLVSKPLPEPGLRSSLAADNTAALFIDYQTQLLLGCQSMDHQKLVNNVLALSHITKMFSLPVVLTTTGGGARGPAGAMLPALTAEFPDEPVIDRTLFFDSMADPVFRQAVEATGRRKLIMAGITTDLCVVFPAITALELGYDVYFVGDASASWDKQINDLAVMRMVQAGVIPVNVQALAAELQSNLAVSNRDAARANQMKLMSFYQNFVGATRLFNDSFFTGPSAQEPDAHNEETSRAE